MNLKKVSRLALTGLVMTAGALALGGCESKAGLAAVGADKDGNPINISEALVGKVSGELAPFFDNLDRRSILDVLVAKQMVGPQVLENGEGQCPDIQTVSTLFNLDAKKTAALSREAQDALRVAICTRLAVADPQQLELMGLDPLNEQTHEAMAKIAELTTEDLSNLQVSPRYQSSVTPGA